MKQRLLVLAMVLVLVLAWIVPAQAGYAGLTNPSFEEGLAAWTIVEMVDSVAVVSGPQTYCAGSQCVTVTPPFGNKMLRIGTPAPTGQPMGANVVSQVFTLASDKLVVHRRLLTHDYQGYNHFSLLVADVETGKIIALHMEGAWGTGTLLKDSGWTPIALNLAGYTGKQVRLLISGGGTKDDRYNTWAYVDMPEPGPGKIRYDYEVIVIDKDGDPVNGATVWAGFVGGDNVFHNVVGLSEPYRFTQVDARGEPARAHFCVLDINPKGHYGVKVHYWDGQKLHEVVAGADGVPGGKVILRVQFADLDV